MQFTLEVSEFVIEVAESYRKEQNERVQKQFGLTQDEYQLELQDVLKLMLQEISQFYVDRKKGLVKIEYVGQEGEGYENEIEVLVS